MPSPLPDLSQLTKIPNVCVLDAFNGRGLELDGAELQRIAKVNNDRFLDTGDMCPLTIGHTNPELPETEQPPIVGWVNNYRVDEWGNLNPRPAIFADLYIKPDMVDAVRQYPRRSVELLPDEGLLDPIALLGSTTPQRGLGLTALSKGSGKKLRFNFAAEPDNMTPDLIAQLTKMAEALNAFLAAIPKADEGAPADDAAAGDAPVQNAADDCPEGTKMSKTDEKTRLELNQTKIQLAKLETELAETRKVADESTRKLRRNEREMQLTQLSYEGVVFDLATEVDYVESMDDAAFTKHVERMKTNFKRNPKGSSPIPARALSLPADQSEKTQLDLLDKAKKYALEHKLTGHDGFKKALEKVKAGA